jgi:hypothetical protein
MAGKMKDTEKALIDIAYPYWETEAEIARRFFRRGPTKAEHTFWLKAQLWKELHPVDGYFGGLHQELKKIVAMFPEVDKTIDRHHFHRLMEQMAQEFNHYVLQADILEYLLGYKIGPEDTFQLREEKKLRDLRRKYVSGSDIEKAAVLVTEGGGARLFREGRKLKGTPLARRIAAAMDTIYRDEKDHCKEAAKRAAARVRTSRDLAIMAKAIRDISLQRLLMRNEMFQTGLSLRELKARIEKYRSGLASGTDTPLRRTDKL